MTVSEIFSDVVGGYCVTPHRICLSRSSRREAVTFSVGRTEILSAMALHESNMDIDNATVSVEKGVLPLSAQSAFSAIPTSRNEPRQLTYFNNEKVSRSGSTYDRLFRVENSYNNKLHRDDREHTKSRGLNVHHEEFNKPFPALMSTAYGHRLEDAVDHPDRAHVRIIKTREFLRNNGICHSVAAGFGNVLPSGL